MALFGLGKGGSSKSTAPKTVQDPGDDGEGFHRSLRKANTFFDYGDTAADSKNFDYAVECYIGGLRHSPDNIERHEQLHDIAKRRSVNGGKPMKPKAVGRSLVDRMLTAEKAWACDWNNINHMVATVEAAVEADLREGEEANLGEVAVWIAGLTIQYNGNPNSKPNRRAYLRIADAMEKIGGKAGYTIAMDAVRRALQLRDEPALRDRVKDLTALLYTAESSEGNEAGGFRGNIKNADEQAAIQAGLDTSGSQTEKFIAAMREQYEENTEDLDRMQKLVDALLRTDEIELEKEAMQLLLKAHDQTGQYRYKVKAGDVKIRQFNRVLRQLNERAQAGDADAKAKLQDGLKKRLIFELHEFGERSQNYPTDLKLKFELGKRQYQAQQFDDAIGNFQQATSEPKSRSASYLFLARCFIHKGWTDEAIDTLEKGIAAHAEPDDVLGKELRYDLMAIRLKVAGENRDLDSAKKAQELASELLQIDINYKDIREKMDEIRKLVDELK